MQSRRTSHLLHHREGEGFVGRHGRVNDVRHDHTRLFALETVSGFPNKHLMRSRLAADLYKYFGLRRTVLKCQVTDTCDAERFCMVHTGPHETQTAMVGNICVKTIIRNNPNVGDLFAARRHPQGDQRDGLEGLL